MTGREETFLYFIVFNFSCPLWLILHILLPIKKLLALLIAFIFMYVLFSFFFHMSVRI